MNREKALLWTLVSASLLSPFLMVFLIIIMDLDIFDVLIIILMMFTMMPIAAAGFYMWITGKGQWAIRGYNTMSKSQQAYYDAERMSKDVGKSMAFMSLLIVAGAFAMLYLPYGLLIVLVMIVLSLIPAIHYSIKEKGTKYLKNPALGHPPKMSRTEMRNRGLIDKEANKKQDRLLIIVVLVSTFSIVPILLGIFFFMGTGDVNISADDDGVKVNAPMVNVYIEYDDIVSVELRDDLTKGSRTNGFGGSNVSSGSFRNAEFGSYTLAAYNGVKTYIVVTPADGKTLVFNHDSVEKTKEFYLELLNKAGLPIPL
jgi:flagellar basal body-associated protein FliL